MVHRRWLLLALIVLTGCSLALSGPAPGRSAREVPRCSTGKSPVALDGILGGTLGVASLALAGDDELGAAAATGLVAAAFVASAVRGNRRVNECRTAHAAYEMRVGRERWARERPAPAGDAPAQPPHPGAAPPTPLPATATPAATPATPVPAQEPAHAPAQTPTPAPSQDGTWADFWMEVP